MVSSKNLKLTDLLVNTENYRFETVASQKEAIDQMVEDQADKLYVLAVHILEHGQNPNDRIQVSISSHNIKKYNVLEGNRRVVTLKLLNNPSLIDNPTRKGLKSKFQKLHDKKGTIKSLECTIYASPSDADKWIKLKHAGQSGGVGTVDWNGQQVQRFEEKVEGKSSMALQTIKILEKSTMVPESLKKNLKKLKITNLDRLISDPSVRNFLGIEVNNGVLQSTTADTEVIKGLMQIAKDLLSPSFKVAKIYTKDDRNDYLDKFPKAKTPNTSKKSTAPWTFTGGSTKSKTKSRTKTTIPKDRTQFIPKSCKLRIKNTKLNSIYHELQIINVSQLTNATAVLFRVFVELSSDCYLERHKLTKGVTVLKSGMNFQQKINTVASHLESKSHADKTICKGIRSAIKDHNSILGINTWHAYVHNNRFSPIPQNLILTWDSMQDFMTILWDNI